MRKSRIVSLAILGILIFILTACSSKNTSNSPIENSQAAAQVTTQTSTTTPPENISPEQTPVQEASPKKVETSVQETTPKETESSEKEEYNITTDRFDFSFIKACLGKGVILSNGRADLIDKNGKWIGTDHSVPESYSNNNVGGKKHSFSFGDLIFEPTDIWDAKPVPEAFNKVCNALVSRGFKLVETDEETGVRYYVNGQVEFNVWLSKCGDNYNMRIGIVTGWLARHVKARD